MKKIIPFIFIAFSISAHCQINIRIKLYVVNSNYRYSLSPRQVKSHSDLKITFRFEDMDFICMDFVNFLNDSTKTIQDSSIIRNFKIKCVLRYNFFVRRVIYFTAIGDYYYKGKYYKKDELFDFIRDNIRIVM